MQLLIKQVKLKEKFKRMRYIVAMIPSGLHENYSL